MGISRTNGIHSGLWRSRNRHAHRPSRQRLFQSKDDSHCSPQARRFAPLVWRVPHAAVRLRISGGHLAELPPYEETFVSVPMDERMRIAYQALEEDIRAALKEHKGNRSVLSNMLNALLLYPDHPYGLGTLYGKEFDPELGRKVKFVIAETQDLPQDTLYAKERRLIEEIKSELAEGRRCQVYAVYTQKRDATARLEQILARKGIRTAVLRRNDAHGQARGLVREEGKRGRSGGNRPSEARRNRTGPARLSYHSFLRIGLLITYPATGREALLANWAETSRACEVHVLRKHHANLVSAPHG